MNAINPVNPVNPINDKRNLLDSVNVAPVLAPARASPLLITTPNNNPKIKVEPAVADFLQLLLAFEPAPW
jgi:hypothetical protein